MIATAIVLSVVVGFILCLVAKEFTSKDVPATYTPGNPVPDPGAQPSEMDEAEPLQ